eukprot:TRINITY_DN7454_c1_g1_i10.p1 TRINITY_DN7454_c1_g1~~TRINITY_DN7454_c1_g1_i10.p1  ORF type:complete len:1168 (+),score=233.88 TRINITY_DN7454_c1_g1_i10:191-3694(+)
MAEKAENVRVAVRVRPPSEREANIGCDVVVNVSGQSCISVDIASGLSKTFNYDLCYSSCDSTAPDFASQDRIARELGGQLLKSTLNGYNGCLFAYGHTGSGKSHSVMGTSSEPGILPWTVDRIFEERSRLEEQPDKEMRVWISYLEIYNEHLRDLLGAPVPGSLHKQENELRVHENPRLGVYVPGLHEEPCESRQQVRRLLEYGTRKRIVAATRMNEYSSRAHSVFTVKVNMLTGQKPKPGEPDKRQVLLAKLNLVDLAGSERQSTAGTQGDHLRESCAINKSLSALALVIKELSGQHDPSAQSPASRRLQRAPPFRVSKLTFLLKDSLAGNSKTCMLATISPASCQVNETVNTLRFASSVKMIRTTATQNRDTNAGLVESLKSELARLRRELADAKDLWTQEVERSLMGMLRDYQEQLEHAKKVDREREGHLGGVGMKTQESMKKACGADSKTPYLLNMSDDPLLAGYLWYHIEHGKPLTIGSSQDNTVCITGLGISERLCIVENTDDTCVVVQKPAAEGRVVVDGVPLQPGERRQLRHGQCLLLGRAFAMRIVIPHCSRSMEPNKDSNLLLEGLDDELVEHSPGWQSLQWALQHTVQLVSPEEACRLVDSAKLTVRNCDEANELTAACRPQDSLSFVTGVVISQGVSVVARVLRNGTEIYSWTPEQLSERLDRMRDAYHTMSTEGAWRPTDVLQDPWHEAHPADVWLRVVDLECQLDDALAEVDNLKYSKNRVAAKAVLMWQSRCGNGNGQGILKITFDAWLRQSTATRRLRRTKAAGRSSGVAARRQLGVPWKQVYGTSTASTPVEGPSSPRSRRFFGRQRTQSGENEAGGAAAGASTTPRGASARGSMRESLQGRQRGERKSTLSPDPQRLQNLVAAAAAASELEEEAAPEAEEEVQVATRPKTPTGSSVCAEGHEFEEPNGELPSASSLSPAPAQPAAAAEARAPALPTARSTPRTSLELEAGGERPRLHSSTDGSDVVVSLRPEILGSSVRVSGSSAVSSTASAAAIREAEPPQATRGLEEEKFIALVDRFDCLLSKLTTTASGPSPRPCETISAASAVALPLSTSLLPTSRATMPGIVVSTLPVAGPWGRTSPSGSRGASPISARQRQRSTVTVRTFSAWRGADCRTQRRRASFCDELAIAFAFYCRRSATILRIGEVSL